MEKTYICECGRTFDNPQKFNGHKSNCKVHQIAKWGSLDHYNEKNKSSGKKVGFKLKAKSDQKKQTALDIWISEQHICEKCGKVMTAKYGSGRFCSQSCANSRPHSEEDKQKISNALKGKKVGGAFVRTSKEKVSNKVTWKIFYCGKYYTNSEWKQKEKALNKKASREQLAKDIDLFNSPYNDFDTVYITVNAGGENYYLTKHNETGQIIARGIVPVYRYIVEYKLGRRLEYNEVVHHIDGNHFNNDPDNLQVLTRTEHNRLHAEMK